jgi:ferritin-like metal-binding protein YciE
MKDNKDALRPYVADMVAVEKHILEAVERQRNDDDIKQFPEALQLVGRLETTLKSHAQALDALVEKLSAGGAASTVKQAVTGVLGAIAGLYDKVRKDTASRALRDDYTALSLASVSYGMLHATALGLSQGPTAELAKSHLAELNTLIMDLGLLLPRVVLKELAFEGYSVDTSAADRAVKNLEETWRSAAQREQATAGAATGGTVNYNR